MHRQIEPSNLGYIGCQIPTTIQWKILAGENFGEFGDLLQIRQSFICQLLVISEKAIEAGLKSAKVFFTKCNLACNSPVSRKG